MIFKYIASGRLSAGGLATEHRQRDPETNEPRPDRDTAQHCMYCNSSHYGEQSWIALPSLHPLYSPVQMAFVKHVQHDWRVIILPLVLSALHWPVIGRSV